MTTAITDQLRSAGPRNKSLLDILVETDHAALALDQQKRYLKDLETQHREAKRNVSLLGHERWKEGKEHAKYRDSVMKRWAYKISGKEDKFAAKAAKEEREYYEVLQKLHQAEALRDNIELMKEEAVRTLGELQSADKRHKQTQKELDQLYASIFQGPTPSFPEEDEAERKVESATEAFNAASAELESGRQAYRALEDAHRRIKSALCSLEDALDWSRVDMFGGGATTDLMERDALHKAETEVIQAQMLVMQAQRFSPLVQSLPPVSIASGSIMSDMLFDNIFTDMNFHEKIKDSRAEVENRERALLVQLQAAKARLQEPEQRAKTESERVKRAREELQAIRQRIFESLANGDQPSSSEAPPPYS
ncbi:hypothetical protein F5Y17DRAFT_15711 [Xylariaceae sp. FL0594]|nr:hypothetical protein F5Y17DRAFT_15711 [Xylariaceae sp. FL0594]